LEESFKVGCERVFSKDFNKNIGRLMMNFLTVFISFFSTPQMLLGFLVCLGLILQRKSFSKILVGTSKAILGIIILFAGIDLLVGALSNISPLVEEVMGGKTFLPMSGAVVEGAMKTIGSTISLVFIGGFIVNVLIARFTRWKYIELSGEHMLYISTLFPVVLAPAGLVGMPSVIVCSIIAGVMYTYMAAITQPYTRIIDGNQAVAIAHPGATGYALSAWLGKKLGDPSKSTEHIKVSDKLAFLNDYAVMTAVIMFLLFMILSLITGPKVMQAKLNIQQNWVTFCILQAFALAAGVMVLLYGVRLLLDEVVPAFHGIAEKIIPNSVPALDCPILFSFAPNAVIIGFIASLVGGALATIAVKLATNIFVLPPIMEHFFMGGTAAIFGNATGGRKGAVIGAIIMGIGLTVLPVLLWQFTKGVVPQMVSMVDTDFGLWGSLVGALGRLIHSLFH
jgi:PTS system ascorbate-specific IIC component